MFGKVNTLLFVIFAVILGSQIFLNWDVASTDSDAAAEAEQAEFVASARSATPRYAMEDAAYAADLGTVDAPSAPQFDRAAPNVEAYAPSQVAEIANAPQPVAETAALDTAGAGLGNDALTPINAEATAPQPIAERAGAQTPLVAPPAAAGANGLPVTYAETLSIRFHGHPEITGLYRVNDDETVSIPVIDRVSVSGLTGAQLETVLAQRVFEITGRNTDVTVEVERYQPVFVSGGVAQPGSFEWRRNMTVMHGVALAGGLYRSPTRQRDGVNLIDARLTLERTRSELRRGIVRAARLQAEQDGLDQIAVPERLIALIGDEEARRLIANEQSLLVSARSASRLELDAIDASLRAAQDETVRLQDFETTMIAKLQERSAFLERMEGLGDRGYISEERLNEVRTTVVDIETRLAQVRVSMSQADAARLKLERDRITLVQARAAEITEELMSLEAEIDQKTLAYQAAIARRSEIAAGQDAAALAAAANEQPTITYSVVRRSAQGIDTMTVNEFEELLPGDIVMVNAASAVEGDPRLAPIN